MQALALILRINDLVAEHELHALVEPLQTALNISKDALNALNQSIEEVKMAEALELIARSNLVRQYEQNYYAVLPGLESSLPTVYFPKLRFMGSWKDDEVEEQK